MIISTRIEVDGKTLSAVIALAGVLSGDPNEDPRGVLIGALAAATLLGSELPADDSTLPGLATAISQFVAVEVEKISNAYEQALSAPATPDRAA